MTLRALALTALLILPAHAAWPADPVQVFVIASAKGCETRVRPGTSTLEAKLPGTQLLDNHVGPTDAPMHSCEVWVPRDRFLAEYQWCALGSNAQSSCWLSMNLHGGRHVSLSAWADGEQAVCGFVCMPR